MKLSSVDRLITRRRHRQCNAIPDQSDEVTSDPCELVVRKTFLMSVSQAQFTEPKQEESVSSKLGAFSFCFGGNYIQCLLDNLKRRASGRIRFSDNPGQPVLVDAKLDDFDLERAAGKGEQTVC